MIYSLLALVQLFFKNSIPAEISEKLGHISQRLSNKFTMACFWFILEGFIEIIGNVISVQNLRILSSKNLSGFKWQTFFWLNSFMFTEVSFEVSLFFILD